MALTENQRDQLLTDLAKDVRRILNHLQPPEEQPRSVRKRDPHKLYGGS